MQVALVPHPDLPHPDIRIRAKVMRHAGDLLLNYFLSGEEVEAIRLPARHPDPYGDRRDGLWKETCFEAFIKNASDPAYCEINISPSGDWASYLFDRYREGMRDGPDIDGPYSDIYVGRGMGIEIQSTYNMAVVPGLPADGPWLLGLSAVIEEECGRKSWWALAHPPGKPDFHHPDCFALELPAP